MTEKATVPLYRAERRCPKCASAAVTTKFCQSRWNNTLETFGPIPAACWNRGGHAPHMHRDCVNCGHTFYERPVDTKAADFSAAAVDKRAKAEAAEREAAAAKRLSYISTPTVSLSEKRRWFTG